MPKNANALVCPPRKFAALRDLSGLHLKELAHKSGVDLIACRRMGGDLKATQEWAGHTSNRITADIYVHAAKDQQRNTAALVGAAAFSPAGNCDSRALTRALVPFDG